MSRRQSARPLVLLVGVRYPCLCQSRVEVPILLQVAKLVLHTHVEINAQIVPQRQGLADACRERQPSHLLSRAREPRLPLLDRRRNRTEGRRRLPMCRPTFEFNRVGARRQSAVPFMVEYCVVDSGSERKWRDQFDPQRIEHAQRMGRECRCHRKEVACFAMGRCSVTELCVDSRIPRPGRVVSEDSGNQAVVRIPDSGPGRRIAERQWAGER